MAIAAKISPAELIAQVNSRFDGAYLEARLINAPGVAYVPGTTDDASFLGFEVTRGLSGYLPQVIGYTSSDLSGYTDDGIGLSTKATVFAHDGTGPAIGFSHVALVGSGGNVLTAEPVLAAPSAGANGAYTNIPVDATTGSGEGLTVDLSIINDGASVSDYAITIKNAGSGYAELDVVTILNGTLAGLGATSGGTGDLQFRIATVSSQSNAGQILSVAQTSSVVSLTGGNEAAFYWNLKQFGFYSVA